MNAMYDFGGPMVYPFYCENIVFHMRVPCEIPVLKKNV